MTNPSAPLFLALALALPGASFAATSEVAEARKQRSQPLQRCDQLKAEAELSCLQRARERIVEVRRDREGASQAVPESAVNAKGAQRGAK